MLRARGFCVLRCCDCRLSHSLASFENPRSLHFQIACVRRKHHTMGSGVTRTQPPAHPRVRATHTSNPARSISNNRVNVDHLPQPARSRHADSLPSYLPPVGHRHRIRIHYADESLRQRSQANVKQLMQRALGDETATATTTSSNAILAWKALKYRNILDRISDVDVNDPTFDASKFLGVEWCKDEATRSTSCALPRKSYVFV